MLIIFYGHFMNYKIKVINTQNAPNPIGPYPQAIDIGPIIFISGQIPIIPNTNGIVPNGIYDQTYQTLQNIRNILESQQLSVNNIVKITLFIDNIQNVSEINTSYSNFFDTYSYKYKDKIIFPARSCVEVSRLPQNVSIEIDAIAIRHI